MTDSTKVILHTEVVSTSVTLHEATQVIIGPVSGPRGPAGGGGGDVTQQYVDDGDADTLLAANAYTDLSAFGHGVIEAYGITTDAPSMSPVTPDLATHVSMDGISFYELQDGDRFVAPDLGYLGGPYAAAQVLDPNIWTFVPGGPNTAGDSLEDKDILSIHSEQLAVTPQVELPVNGFFILIHEVDPADVGGAPGLLTGVHSAASITAGIGDAITRYAAATGRKDLDLAVGAVDADTPDGARFVFGTDQAETYNLRAWTCPAPVGTNFTSGVCVESTSTLLPVDPAYDALGAGGTVLYAEVFTIPRGLIDIVEMAFEYEWDNVLGAWSAGTFTEWMKAGGVTDDGEDGRDLSSITYGLTDYPEWVLPIGTEVTIRFDLEFDRGDGRWQATHWREVQIEPPDRISTDGRGWKIIARIVGDVGVTTSLDEAGDDWWIGMNQPRTLSAGVIITDGWDGTVRASPMAADAYGVSTFVDAQGNTWTAVDTPEVLPAPAAPIITDLDDVPDSATRLAMSDTERTKLTGIEAGAEVNTVDSVNALTGAVVLGAGDVGADVAGAAAAAQAAAVQRANHTGTQAPATITGTAVVDADPRLTDARTPTAHNHAASEVTSGTLGTARLGTGTADGTTFLRGDQTWATPSGSAGLVATSDTTVTNSTTLTNVPGLSFAIGADEKWVVEIVLSAYSSSNTPKIDIALTQPAGCDATLSGVGTRTADNLLQAFGSASGGSGTRYAMNVTTAAYGGVAHPVRVRAAIVNSSTAGTIQVQFSQTVANAAGTTVYARSSMIATKVA